MSQPASREQQPRGDQGPPRRYADAMSFDGRWPFTVLCLAIASGFALDLAATSWIAAVIIGVIVAVGVGGTVDGRIRHHRGFPPRRALFDLGHKDQPPHR